MERAIVISTHGGPEVLTVTELPDPVAGPGEILIRVGAFGLNHAEAYTRSGAWGQVAAVPGIECAGLVEADPSGELPVGKRVVAILGGMGRTRNGSYAELVTVPATNVAAVETRLPWADLAAVPEVYATAYSALNGNLALGAGETLLVRGAVVDALLDLVGNSVLRDSLAAVGPRGRVCQAGFLGGFAPVVDFDPIADLPSGVRLSFFGSAFVLGSRAFPLSAVPLDAICAQVEAGVLKAPPHPDLPLRRDRRGPPGDGGGPGPGKDGRHPRPTRSRPRRGRRSRFVGPVGTGAVPSPVRVNAGVAGKPGRR
ncbi:alcohol dehydrogenase catalytic domain-containing protein [Kitasatospora purpeofusca]|uniref:alcohol dehydrogenase catalytic domain-containing protein n=1 Tax=Kitasatospora purpeofusca TaxID=67352 RepID=UPI004063337A